MKKKKELGKQKEEVEKNVENLTSKLNKLWGELEIMKKVTNLADSKRKICEEELSKKDNEIIEIGKKVKEMERDAELQIHSYMEKHISNFVKSNTCLNIVDLYRLLIMVLAFDNCRKRAKA